MALSIGFNEKSTNSMEMLQQRIKVCNVQFAWVKNQDQFIMVGKI